MLDNPIVDLDRRFGGVGRLYGAAAAQRLAAAHVCVIGIGGVGSWAAEALARSGVARLTLIDLDHVAESNINRQSHALEATLGMAKVRAMAERIAGINPLCQVAGIEEFITAANVAACLPICDAVIDAIDQTRAKAALIAHCHSQGLRVVTCGAAGGRTDPLAIRCTDLALTVQDRLSARVRSILRRAYGFTRAPLRPFGIDCIHSPQPLRPLAVCASTEVATPLSGLNCAGYGSSMCVTAAFGLAAAAWVINRIVTASPLPDRKSAFRA